MPKPPAYDIERITYINNLMGGIHYSCDSIYESLIDRDFVSLVSDIDGLMATLRGIKESLEDDIE